MARSGPKTFLAVLSLALLLSCDHPTDPVSLTPSPPEACSAAGTPRASADVFNPMSSGRILDFQLARTRD